MVGFCLDYRRSLPAVYRRLRRVFLLLLLLRRVLRLPPTATLTPFFDAFKFLLAFELVLTLALTFLETFADNVFVDGTELFCLDDPVPIVSILLIGFIN
jgi:hypothetical protein